MPGYEFIDHEEKAALNELFDEGAVLFAHGFQNQRKKFHVREFEAAASQYFGSKYALAVSSGTAAIKVALKGLGIKNGDEVITQAHNFVATIEAIVDCGAKPIIANVDETLNICAKDLEKRITKSTKAIIVVHMLGIPADLEAIMPVAKKHGIPVVEDNCEAIGSKINGNYCGTITDIGVMSFDHGKMMTTGEGGMIFTNNYEIDKICREYHDHGHENNPDLPRGRDTRTKPGFNYRMTEMQAVIGKVQLNKLNRMIIENKKRYDILFEVLSQKFKVRPCATLATGNMDTFILTELTKTQVNKLLGICEENKFGTKNIPDAMEWHCAYFWDHMLLKSEAEYALPTKEALMTSIAVPISFGKTLKDYETLANAIKTKLAEK